MSDTGSDDDDMMHQPRSGAPNKQPHHNDEEDEFEFEQNFTTEVKKSTLKKTLDKPFDEVHEVSDSQDDSTLESPATSPMGKQHYNNQPQHHHQQQQHHHHHQQSFSQDEDDEQSESMMSEGQTPKKNKSKDKKSSSQPMQGKPGNIQQQMMSKSQHNPSDIPQKAGSSSDEDEESEEEDEEHEEDGGNKPPSQAAVYNPNDYKHLVVSSEIQGLFDHILRHKHTDIELETKMKPFIPDYIPAVGEIDAFLKVPPPELFPELKKNSLGLVVLDEPAAHQSDPTVLELSLRAVNKQVISKHAATVGTIEHADKNTARVLKWIQSIEDVHRKKPPPHVHYSRPMPDIEQLMQVWPPEFEEMLKSQQFQIPDMQGMDCDVGEFAKMVCAIMDIPVYDKVTESLHVLFTLYSEFQNHAYFQH